MSPPAASLAEVQSYPEVPAIAHFCSLFHHRLGLPEFEIEELEEALLSSAASQSAGSGRPAQQDFFVDSFLDELVVKLLEGCISLDPGTITNTNYFKYLKQLIQTKIEDYEEEDHDVPIPFEDPFQTEDAEDFSELSLLAKVRVIKLLTEFRLEAEDITQKLKDIDADSLRVEPVGVDADGTLYWYFFGTRLYREVEQKKVKKKEAEIPAKPAKKGKSKETAAAAKSKKGRKNKQEAEEKKVEVNNGGEDTAANPTGWSVVCTTEQDWNQLADRLRKTKRKHDKEVYETLRDNFLSEIAQIVEEKDRERKMKAVRKERDERIKLLMLNKRSSSRIDKKREREEREREEREQAEREREREEEARQREEEQLRSQREKENALKKREERIRQRDELGQRRLQVYEEERKREDQERKRKLREWMELDHDYVGSRRFNGATTTATTTAATVATTTDRKRRREGSGNHHSGRRASDWDRLHQQQQQGSGAEEENPVRFIRF